VGSFIVHVDGENLLTDPGPGLYSRAYFSVQRYENIFANSYGHSVPRVAGQMQQAGREYHGELFGVGVEEGVKRAVVELARAYPVPALQSAQRLLSTSIEGAEAGVIRLVDEFHFTGVPAEVEEAFVTWYDVELEGASATIHGGRHHLRLTVEAPEGARFRVERLEEQCKANAKAGVLKRLTFVVRAAAHSLARVRMEVLS
jgi:hypothetical protein